MTMFLFTSSRRKLHNQPPLGTNLGHNKPDKPRSPAQHTRPPMTLVTPRRRELAHPWACKCKSLTKQRTTSMPHRPAHLRSPVHLVHAVLRGARCGVLGVRMLRDRGLHRASALAMLWLAVRHELTNERPTSAPSHTGGAAEGHVTPSQIPRRSHVTNTAEGVAHPRHRPPATIPCFASPIPRHAISGQNGRE